MKGTNNENKQGKEEQNKTTDNHEEQNEINHKVVVTFGQVTNEFSIVKVK